MRFPPKLPNVTASDVFCEVSECALELPIVAARMCFRRFQKMPPKLADAAAWCVLKQHMTVATFQSNASAEEEFFEMMLQQFKFHL